MAIQYRPGETPRGVFLCARVERRVLAFAVLVLLSHLARFAPVARAQTALEGAIVDLSHPYDADTIYWPTEEGFVLERIKELQGQK